MTKNTMSNGNNHEHPITLGLSQNTEIRELQQKVLELLKLINNLKQKTELALQDLQFQIRNMTKELEKMQQNPCCTKVEDITKINLFLAKLENLDLSDSLEKMSEKITNLNLKVNTNQTRLTTLFAVLSTLIAIAAIIIPIFFK